MLEVRELSVSYGRHRALEGAGLTVAKGEICVILGANGAGKSTLLKAIAGTVRPDPGATLLIDGRSIAGAKPHAIVEQGIALVPEGRGIFGELTVAENLRLGAFATRARSGERATLDRIYGLFPRLAERRRQVARTMSGGEQQMVAIGRALMSNPEILMLDEPSLGLSPLLTRELFRTLTDIAATGVGILLVEQNARQSLKIARRGYLIENGRVAGGNSARELMSDRAVVAAYLGGGASGGTAVRLPAPMRLPADVAGIGGLVSDLAARAGRIHAAFVRSLRRGGDTPAAFVGRYDPRAMADPWHDLVQEPPRRVAPAIRASWDARALAAGAALLAERADHRHTDFIRTQRLSRAAPSAFSAPSRLRTPVRDAGPVDEAGETSLIGHNSAGVDVDAEERGKTGRQFLSELAARAASIHAAHVADRRKALAAFHVQVQPLDERQPSSDASGDNKS